MKIRPKSGRTRSGSGNESRHIDCGAPEFIVARNGFTVGYVEAKDVGKSLADTERSEQLKRYRRSLANLILIRPFDFPQ